MNDFDDTRSLVMAQFKTVDGFGLTKGTALTVVDQPAATGEVTAAMARRLWLSGVAIYADDYRPTPVETSEHEAARIVDEDLPDVPDDLKTTNKELRVIAEAEAIEVGSDDVKAELQTKIIAGRAARAQDTQA